VDAPWQDIRLRPPPISYDYDANGNLFHRTDGSGITTLVSDAASRLTSKAIPGGPTLTYGYDVGMTA
jgi:YD repeat-containing protein